MKLRVHNNIQLASKWMYPSRNPSIECREFVDCCTDNQPVKIGITLSTNCRRRSDLLRTVVYLPFICSLTKLLKTCIASLRAYRITKHTRKSHRGDQRENWDNDV